MNRTLVKTGWLLSFFLAVEVGSITKGMAMTPKNDVDFQWLEEVEGQKALSWVREQNARSLKSLRAYPQYEAFKQNALTILQAKDKIPYGTILGPYVYNFWQDAQHVRGIWRRAPWASYEQAKPQWETLLDVDALGAKEGKSYVFGGAQCLRPQYERCLIRLSEGGSDAAMVREFDVKTKSFVKDGFSLPASKSSLTWLDENRVFFNNALTPATQTSSGYSIETRLWQRGTSYEKSSLLFTGEKSDVEVDSFVVYDGETPYAFVSRALSFYTSELYALQGETLKKLPLPQDVEFKGLYRGQLLLSNRSPLATHKAGSLLAVDLAAMLRSGQPQYELVFAPNAQQAIDGTARSLDFFYVTVMDQVRDKVLRLQRPKAGGAWVTEVLPIEDKGKINLISVDESSNRMLFSYEDFLVPESLYAADGQSGAKKLVMRVPPRFQAEGLEMSQEFALSTDGTKIPYFLVHKKGLKLDGTHPTLLYAYGGFEISMQPGYSGLLGKLWLERGGVYALANIRGGGEYGPTWHQAALKENRQKAFDDFVAVSRDLIARQITSPAHLGIRGGSNGGLLMGATFTQHPELYQAVICQVPLLDMLRYHKLLAGASWMAEYGDPEDPKMASVLKGYSPFHNVRTEKSYPEVFFVTSTKDDRVHPGHARKMAARMEELKKPFLYFENIEGGHSASADLVQSAERAALEYSYLWQKLAPALKAGAKK